MDGTGWKYVTATFKPKVRKLVIETHIQVIDQNINWEFELFKVVGKNSID